MFTGRADAGDAGFLSAPTSAADFVTDGVVGLEGVLAPQMGSVAHLDLAILNPQIHRVIGAPTHYKRIETGFLQIVGPVAAAFGLAPDTGERAARADSEAI